MGSVTLYTFCMVSMSCFLPHSSYNVHCTTPDGVFISLVTAGKKLEMSVKTSQLSSDFSILLSSCLTIHPLLACSLLPVSVFASVLPWFGLCGLTTGFFDY